LSGVSYNTISRVDSVDGSPYGWDIDRTYLTRPAIEREERQSAWWSLTSSARSVDVVETVGVALVGGERGVGEEVGRGVLRELEP